MRTPSSTVVVQGVASALALACGLALSARRTRRASKPARRAKAGSSERRGDVPRAPAEMITPETDRAIQAGLAWLAKQQNADGSFGTGAYRGNIAVTSLRAWRSWRRAPAPAAGPTAPQIDKALAVRDGQHQPLGLHRHPAGRHPRPDVLARLRHAVPGRGLRHDPPARDPREAGEGRPADHRHPERRGRLALPAGPPRRRPVGHRSARSTPCAPPATPGIFVPKETVDACIRYVKQSQNPDGGFRYMLQGGASAFPRSAAGVVALYSAGGLRRQGGRRGHRLPEAVHPRDQVRPALQPLLLRPLLRGAGDVDPRRRRLERLVSRHPRRAGPPRSRRRATGSTASATSTARRWP